MLPTNPLLNATAPAGPHLPVALLRQYAAGTLAAAAQHRVEAHTLACSRCADVLEGLLQSPAATTDQALAQLQQRLRKRVQQQAAPARLARRQPRWVALQLAAAVALLLGLVAGGWWTWQQRRPTPPAATKLIQNPTAAPLLAPEAVRTRATPPSPALTPAPAGGYAALRKQLRRQAAGFVPEAPGRRLSGTVRLRLTIGADGKIQQVSVLRGLRADYDAQAERLVRQGPAWVPGSSGGQQVEVAVPF